MKFGSRGDVASSPAGISFGSFVVRTASGAMYALLLMGAIVWGSIPTAVVVGVLSGFCVAEFYALERRGVRLMNEVFGVLVTATMPLAAALWGKPGPLALITMLLAASLVWHTMFVRVRTAGTAETVFGAMYTGFLLSYLVLIRMFEGGLVLTIALVLSVWASDVFAYVFGSLLGRHKMVPRISPNKSWEGFVAGLIGCTAIWSLVPVLGDRGWIPDTGVSSSLAIATGVVVGIAAVIGDLVESRFKREVGVKDSGHILPGHGGLLDRMDSLITACLAAYWLLWWGGFR